MVVVAQGILEGGCLGPLLYPLTPNSLMMELQAAGCGFGLGVVMPQAWLDYVWRGDGSPDDHWVEPARSGLRGVVALRPKEALAANPDLEASCARALDLEAPMRIAVIFHADDPVFLNCSRGATLSTLAVLESWGTRNKARLHTGADKSVVIVSGSPNGPDAISSAPPVTFFEYWDKAPSVLTIVTIQKWLGLLWPADLHFSQAFFASFHAASGAYSALVDMVASKARPLAWLSNCLRQRWMAFSSSPVGCSLNLSSFQLHQAVSGNGPWVYLWVGPGATKWSQHGCWAGGCLAATKFSVQSHSGGPNCSCSTTLIFISVQSCWQPTIQRHGAGRASTCYARTTLLLGLNGLHPCVSALTRTTAPMSQRTWK